MAHSNIGSPLAFSALSCIGDRADCSIACPSVPQKPWNTPKTPAAVWKRGQQATVIWHKNSRIGGFYKMAFEWDCWSQGSFKCGKSAICGRDKQGRTYTNNITVPAVFPGGAYVVAQTWYGGLHWQIQRAHHSDYYSCSFVRIQGGDIQSSYTPKFRPNLDPTTRLGQLGSLPRDVCATRSTRIPECEGGPCVPKKVQYTVPDEFADGHRPTPLSALHYFTI